MTAEITKRNRIKEVLAEKGITGKLLAEYLDKGESTISTWCSNTHQPSIPELYNIAEFLRVDIRNLLLETVWPVGPSPASLAKERNIKKRTVKKTATKTKNKR